MNAPAAQVQITPYELLGGEEALRRLVDRFYELMDQDPAAAGLRRMHAADLSPMRAKLFDWLSEWMGGPARYRERPDRACMMSAHMPYAIGADERDQWMHCMRTALAELELAAEVREFFAHNFQQVADRLRNR
ncbi:MAG: group II truncated hemoglobin [Gammaproteobacteria bacterium]